MVVRGVTLVVTTLSRRRRLEELPADAPATPAQQNTQQMMETQMETGMIMVTTITATTIPTTRAVISIF